MNKVSQPIFAILLAGLCVCTVPSFAQDSSEPTAETSAQMPIVQHYDTAAAYLEKICEDYRRIKAIQLSQQRNISVAQAYADINSVMPILDPIERDILSRPVYDPAQIRVQQAAIADVEAQIDMMIELAAKLLEEIEQVSQEILDFQTEQTELTLEEILQKEQFDPEAVAQNTTERYASEDMQTLAEMAQQTASNEAKDLTQVMRPLLPNIQDLTEEQQGEALRQDLMVSRSADNSLETLNSIVDLQNLNKISGRVIAQSGEPVEWLFVDTWYTVGPFPNPSRANLNRVFPPESIVDLDASYPGKDERRVGWQFVQSTQIPSVPANDESYAIYYAYTELYLDQPMDLWVAIGGDDKADVWLNDLPIYSSGDQLKGWKPNEAFRKVSFLAGRNRILFRIENGWLATAFSFAIRTTE